MAEDRVRLTARVRGQVQGVGFRWSVRSFAMHLKLIGSAENLMDGDVQVIAEGAQQDCQKLLDWLTGSGGSGVVRRPGKVTHVSHEWGQAQGGFRSFAIL